MEEADSLPCSTCRLLDTETLKEEEEARETLLLFILPGAAMILLALR